MLLTILDSDGSGDCRRDQGGADERAGGEPEDKESKGEGEAPARHAPLPTKNFARLPHTVYTRIDANVWSLRVVVKAVRRRSAEAEILQSLGGQHYIAALICASAEQLVMPYYSDRPVQSLHELARLAADLGEALAFLHVAGWVHRDVKRANVRFTGETGAVLIDFDIARRWRETDPPLPGVVGTRYWRAPEVSHVRSGHVRSGHGGAGRAVQAPLPLGGCAV